MTKIVVQQSRNASQIRIWLFSACGAGVAYFLFPLWYVNNPSYVDPWIYWGTAEVPQYAFTNFGDTYYARRWTVIAPLILFQQVLDPYSAQLVHGTLKLFMLLGVAGTFVLQMSRRELPAILTVGLFCSTAYTVFNVGLTYHQGTGLLIFFTLCLAIWRIESTRHVSLLLILSGSLFGLLIVTYGYGIYFLPAFIILMWLQINSRLRKARMGRSGRMILEFLALAFTGFILTVTIVDHLVGRLFQQDWELLPLFLVSQSDIAAGFYPEGTYPQQLLSVFLNPASFAGISMTILPLSLYIFNRQQKYAKMKRWTYFGIAIFIPYLIGTPIRNNGLWWPWMNVYLFSTILVTVALLISLVFLDLFALRLLPRIWLVFFVAATLSLWVLLQKIFFSSGPSPALLTFFSSGFLLSASIFYCSIYERQPKSCRDRKYPNLMRPVVGFLTILLSLVLSLGVATSKWNPAWAITTFPDEETARTQIVNLSQEIRGIAGKAMNENRRVWILDLRPNLGWSPLVSSLYGMYSALGVGVPPDPLDCTTQADWVMSYPNSAAVVLGPTSSEIASEAILAQFSLCEGPTIERLDSSNRPSNEYWFRLTKQIIDE